MGFDEKLTFDWGKVLSEIQGFNKLLLKKAPPLVALKAANNMMNFTLWVKQCTLQYGDLLAISREASLFLRKGGTEEQGATLLQRFQDYAQKVLNTVAPERFTYQGFQITNGQHLEETLCLRALGAVDLLKATFRKRGVEKLLLEGLDRINLAVTGGAPNSMAFYGSLKGADVPEITLFAGPKSTGTLDSNGLSTFIHEFGHHVYYAYLPREARVVWDAPWKDITPSKVERLEIPTSYGKSDKFEDFAETFVVFMTKPEMLTPTSKYRMQQVLSLSGFYGKPVMRNARLESIGRVADRYVRATSGRAGSGEGLGLRVGGSARSGEPPGPGAPW